MSVRVTSWIVFSFPAQGAIHEITRSKCETIPANDKWKFENELNNEWVEAVKL
jgi:hypothetical protein